MDGDAMPGFHEFVVARYAALLRTAFVLTGSQLAAEDLVQTALARTAARWSRLSDPGELDGYVRRVMYHEQISLWRRTVRIRETATSSLPEPPGADHSHRVEVAVVVGAALAQLTVRQRAVLTLRYFDDVDESGAAHILGVSVGTVRSQTAKALARLRILAPELQQLTQRRAVMRLPSGSLGIIPPLGQHIDGRQALGEDHRMVVGQWPMRDRLRLYDLAAPEEVERWEAHDAVPHHDLRILITIDLGDCEAVAVLRFDLFKNRHDHLAGGTTPPRSRPVPAGRSWRCPRGALTIEVVRMLEVRVMWAWIAVIALCVAPLLLAWWIRRNPTALRGRTRADPDDAWLAETYGLSAAQRQNLRAAVRAGEVVDPDVLRPAAAAYARRLQGHPVMTAHKIVGAMALIAAEYAAGLFLLMKAHPTDVTLIVVFWSAGCLLCLIYLPALPALLRRRLARAEDLNASAPPGPSARLRASTQLWPWWP